MRRKAAYPGATVILRAFGAERPALTSTSACGGTAVTRAREAEAATKDTQTWIGLERDAPTVLGPNLCADAIRGECQGAEDLTTRTTGRAGAGPRRAHNLPTLGSPFL